ncbi:MAG: hypothetical protein ACR2KL_02540 [Nocardioidaceae bacterium]
MIETDAGAPLPTGPPPTVLMLQGRPTRVDVGGVRCRFGINFCSAKDQTIHFTVLHGEQLEGFTVRLGDEVEALSTRWRVSRLDPTDGAAELGLTRLERRPR